MKTSKNGFFYATKKDAMTACLKLPPCSKYDVDAIRVKSGKFGYFVAMDTRYFSDNDMFFKAQSMAQKHAIERPFIKESTMNLKQLFKK